MRNLILLIASVGAAVVAAGLLVDAGEVVTLTSEDDEGRHIESELWVVDVPVVDRGGDSYLRATRTADWLSRVRTHPDVTIARDGVSRTFRAVPVDDASVRDGVNRAMASKYGRFDWILSHVRDYSHAVPVRLEPGGEGHAFTEPH